MKRWAELSSIFGPTLAHELAYFVLVGDLDGVKTEVMSGDDWLLLSIIP